MKNHFKFTCLFLSASFVLGLVPGLSYANPQTILSANGNIDVQSIVATATPMQYEHNRLQQDEILHGDPMKAMEKGVVGLLESAPHKVMKVTFGKVTLATSDSFTLDMVGGQLIEVEVKGPLREKIAKNHGSMDAENGVITLTSAMAQDVVDGVVSYGGLVNATKLIRQDEKIILIAEASNAE